MTMGGGVVSKKTQNVELPTIEANASRNINPSSTENSNSYTSNIVQIGKGNLRLNEIPQSVSVVTRQRLDDQNLQTLSEAMRQTPGVTILPFGNEDFSFIIRGYEVDRFQFDGITAGASSSGGKGNLDTAIFDHIEVLKGPSGLLQGSGEPAGTINLVRKRALRDFSVRGTLMGGSWESYREEADITGAFDKKGNFRGRLVAVKDDREFYIDEIYSDKTVFYGTLEYDFTPNTTLSIGGVYQKVKYVPQYGVPIGNGYLLNIPRSTFLGDKWNRSTQNMTRYFVDLEHHLSNGGEIRFATSALHSISHEIGEQGTSIPDTAGNVGVRQLEFDNENNTRSIDAYISTPFELFHNSHSILVGMSSNSDKFFSNWYNIASVTKNIFDLTHDYPEPNYTNTSPGYLTKTTENAMYGQLKFKVIKNITLVGGGRLSWYENKTDKIRINAKITPYAGIIYDITNEYSIYASYANVFVPQTNHTVDNKLIKPRTGNQYEIGAKAEWFDGSLNASSAFFWIDDENRAASDPDNPKFSVAMGKLRSIGGEIEVSGSIMPWWDILAGYTYITTKSLVGNYFYQQYLFANTPKHSFKLWSSHAIRDFKIGYGVITSSSSIYTIGESKKPLQGSYAVFSAMLGYKINKNFDLALNVDNIFDKKYYSRGASGEERQNYFGDPRNFMLTIRAKY